MSEICFGRFNFVRKLVCTLLAFGFFNLVTWLVTQETIISISKSSKSRLPLESSERIERMQESTKEDFANLAKSRSRSRPKRQRGVCNEHYEAATEQVSELKDGEALQSVEAKTSSTLARLVRARQDNTPTRDPVHLVLKHRTALPRALAPAKVLSSVL